MEEAYETALQQVGGLEEAKPKAVLELLQGAHPHLTIQVGRHLGIPPCVYMRVWRALLFISPFL
jgi:hypothetical protein